MSVIRIQKTENFVILAKEVLDHPGLSFKAKGLWAYCLSKPNDWKFHVSHLASVSKDGEDAIYSAIKELISAGYCERIQKLEDGRFSYLEYVFHETSQLKKSLPNRDFPDAVLSDAGKPALLSIESKKLRKDNTKESSAVASDLSHYFLSKIKEIQPDFRPKAFEKWAQHFDLMMRLDGRGEDRIRSVISYLTSDPMQLVYVQSAKKLREDFDRIEMRMKASAEKTAVSENRTYAVMLKNQYPKEMKAMSFDKDYVRNLETGKEVPFRLPKQTFKDALVSMFGGSYVR